METFTVGDKGYNLMVKTSYFIVGQRNDDCCSEVLVTDGAKLHEVRYFKPTTVNKGISLLTASHLENPHSGKIRDNSSTSVFDIYGIPSLGSQLIEGTSKDVKYVTLVKTDSGVVARRGVDKYGLAGVRIRVVPNSNYVWEPPYHLNEETELGWETQDQHLAEQGYNIARTLLVIAQGVKVLLGLSKK